MPKGKIRFAIIGCGRVAGNHLAALHKIPDAQLVAVCDLVEERASKYGKEYDVPAYTDYHKMLSVHDVDAVCVITPSGMHPEHVIDVISRYGKHIVVEKPMALRLSDAYAMGDAADKAGVRIFPVYQNRYNKAVAAIKKRVDDGVLGRIALASVRLHWCRPQRYYDLSEWRGTWAMDGGAFTNQGIHYLDLLLHLVGDVSQLYSVTATQFVNVEVEDTGVATLRFKSGTLGSVEITTAARPDDAEATISLLGENGSAVLAGLAANRLSIFTPEPELCSTSSESIPNAYGFGHEPFIADVVTDLQGGKRHPVSFQEGLRAIRLLNALYRSAEDGVPVDLDDEPQSARLGARDNRLASLYTTSAPSDQVSR